MGKKISFFLFFLSVFFSELTGYEVVGYYENWSQYWTNYQGGRFAATPASLGNALGGTYLNGLTVMNYAFAFFHYGVVDSGNPAPQSSWAIYPSEWNDVNYWNPDQSLWKQPAALKTKYPSLQKVMLSIGGWSFCTQGAGPNSYGSITYQYFSQMVANSTYYNEFIESAVNICKGVTYSGVTFDGIDIDWEFPACAGLHGGSSADYQNLLTFLEACYTRFQMEGLTLTMTIPAIAPIPSGLVNGSYMDGGMTYNVSISDPSTYYRWIGHLSDYLDWLNVMCYDMYGPGYSAENNTVTADNGPLYTYPVSSSNYSIEQGVEDFIAGGVPAAKLVIGLPAYGHTFAGIQPPSQWNPTSEPNGPGCPFTGPDEGGPLTNQSGYLSYIEIYQGLSGGSLTSSHCYASTAFKLPPTVNAPIYSYALNSETFATKMNSCSYYTTARYNPDTGTYYAYNLQTAKWVSFDAPSGVPFTSGQTSSIVQKCQFIRDHDLGGAMVWALDEDYYLGPYPSILQTVVEALD